MGTPWVGDDDAFTLVNICGIRGSGSQRINRDLNYSIIKNLILKSLDEAIELGLPVFLVAMGLGVWEGDPDVYIPATLDAIITAEKRPFIGYNPNHAPIDPNKQHVQYDPRLAGKRGEEFEEWLNKYKEMYADDSEALAKLNSIVNLSKFDTDLIFFIETIKQIFGKKVAIINASDPDVLLGFLVGQYSNQLTHWRNTTEEHYSRLTLNLLLSEQLTQIHEPQNAHRIIGPKVAAPVGKHAKRSFDTFKLV